MGIEYEIVIDIVGHFQTRSFDDLPKALEYYFETVEDISCKFPFDNTAFKRVMFFQNMWDEYDEEDEGDYSQFCHEDVLNLYEDYYGEKKEETSSKEYIL